MEHHRSSANQLFSFEISIDVRWQVFLLHHGGEALLDRVESLHRSTIVVLPMRTNQFFRESPQLSWIEWQRSRLMLTAERPRCCDNGLIATRDFRSAEHQSG